MRAGGGNGRQYESFLMEMVVKSLAKKGGVCIYKRDRLSSPYRYTPFETVTSLTPPLTQRAQLYSVRGTRTPNRALSYTSKNGTGSLNERSTIAFHYSIPPFHVPLNRGG